jgi:hypothetical protein
MARGVITQGGSCNFGETPKWTRETRVLPRMPEGEDYD